MLLDDFERYVSRVHQFHVICHNIHDADQSIFALVVEGLDVRLTYDIRGFYRRAGYENGFFVSEYIQIKSQDKMSQGITALLTGRNRTRSVVEVASSNSAQASGRAGCPDRVFLRDLSLSSSCNPTHLQGFKARPVAHVPSYIPHRQAKRMPV